jgi:agmatinase
MHNVLAQTSVDSIVQVGLRDLCPQESQVIANDYRISALRDFDMHRACIQGRTLESVLMDMVNLLPTQVYISFDIDGLNPAYCPNTGTPVPGGFEFEDALFLIESLIKTGREIIGFDLVEVAPGESGEWDANVGARMLYRLGNLAYFSRTLSRGELFL